MKKWADLKCDGKRRIAALRGPNGTNLRKKKLGPVERMVHKILMMSPRGGEATRMNSLSGGKRGDRKVAGSIPRTGRKNVGGVSERRERFQHAQLTPPPLSH